MCIKVLRGVLLFSAVSTFAVGLSSCGVDDGVSYDADECEEFDDYHGGNEEHEYVSTSKLENMARFALNSSAVSSDPSNMDVLREVAQKLLSDDKTTLRIEGHCDQRGTREYNMALSERRGSALKAVLVGQYKVPEGRIVVLGKGKDSLLINEEHEHAYSQNRRAEFFLIVYNPAVDATRKFVEQNPSGETDWELHGTGYEDDINFTG